MKKQILSLSLLAITGAAQAQTGVGIGTVTPNASAALDVDATNKGLLLPRVALTGTANFAPLAAHVAGMTVYNTATAGNVTPGFYYNNGTQWVRTLNTETTASNGLTRTANTNNIVLGGPLTGPTVVSNIGLTNTLEFRGPADSASYITVGSNRGASGGVFFGNPNHGIQRGLNGSRSISDTSVSGSDNDVAFYTRNGGTGSKLFLVNSPNSASNPGNKNLPIGQFTLESNGNIGIGTTTPNASAALDITATNKGLLLPRVALTSTANFAPLAAHVAGMTVYNTATAGNVTPGFYYNDGTQWVRTLNFATASNGLTQTSNNNTVLGGPLTGPTTVSNITLANTLEFRGPADSVSSITVGSTALTGGSVFFGNPNHGIQRNLTSGRSISDSLMGGGNDVAFYTSNGGSNSKLFLINSEVAGGNKNLPLGQFTLERNGNVGIGTTTPQAPLHVSGTSGIIVPNGTTAQRTVVVFGTIRYNTSIGRGEMYVNDVNADGTQGDAGWRPM